MAGFIIETRILSLFPQSLYLKITSLCPLPVTAVLSTASFKVLAFDSVVKLLFRQLLPPQSPLQLLSYCFSSISKINLSGNLFISLIVGSVPPICAISLYSYSVSIVDRYLHSFLPAHQHLYKFTVSVNAVCLRIFYRLPRKLY